jgi:acyl-CoA synthetase (AMP-forming)/AMP-acid ligase II
MPSALDSQIDAVVAAITAPGGPLAVGHATIRGVDYPVFTNAPATMRDFLAFFFAANATKEFLVYRDERTTFAEVHAASLKVAAVLQARGIAKGDRVAIAMRNYPEWITTYCGALILGAVAVPMNAWWKGEELAYGIAHSGTRLVIADEERARRLAALPGFATPVLTTRTSADVAAGLGFERLDDALAEAADSPWYLPPVDPEDDATIMYTSGSTGEPKGAVATQRALVSGSLNYLVTGLALLQLSAAAGNPAPEQQVMLLNVPLFHITGSVPVLLVSIAIGRKMIIMHKWDAGDALRMIAEEKATYFVGVPTMSLELMNHPDRSKYDLSSLVDIASGGAPRPPEHVERLLDAFPGKHPVQGYGLTETNGVGAGIYRDNYLTKPSSTGRAAAPLVEIGIFDDDMVAQPAGTVGEVCIKTVAACRGYWRAEAATKAAFVAGGWFRTGDLGRLDDDGYLFIVDRKKDIIIRGGENISCQEVESALYAHPAVAEACVFGLPDERLGEIVGAVIQPKPGAALEAEALTQFVARDLASYKVPAQIWFSAEPLPKLGSAKIDKVTLRGVYRALYAATEHV